METIKSVLIERDSITPEEADELISEAKAALQEYLDNGDTEEAENICNEYFGLEPDFLFELI